MNEGMVRKWVTMFNVGRTNVNEENRSDRPSLVTDDLVMKLITNLSCLSCHTGIQTVDNGLATPAITEDSIQKFKTTMPTQKTMQFKTNGEEYSVTELCCCMTMLGLIPPVTLKHWFDNFVGSSSITRPTARTWHRLTTMKHELGGQRYETDDVKTAVDLWLRSLAGTLYEEGIDKLITRYDK
ncbi:hypothetical protein J6590_019157 [Homalodisca vitripennis]|nr:hypothetical protein J6590_019157 [Homalodisca vitripennis]